MYTHQDTDWDRKSLKRRKSVASMAASTLPSPFQFLSLKKTEEQLKKIKKKSIRKFYEHQNEVIDRYIEVDEVIEELKLIDQPFRSTSTITSFHEIPGIEEEELNVSSPLIVKSNGRNENTPSWLVHLAINVSFVFNVALFLTKLFLAIVTGSMAILASAFESFLDILSNGIIYFTIRVIRKRNFYDYPVGKARMEPLGIIVFAVVITTSFSEVLIQSVERLMKDPDEIEEIDLGPLSLSLLAANIIIKGALWVWCYSIKGSSSVQALAQDHENDVVFNIASTIFPVVAASAHMPWLDPLGAIFLSLYIIYEWVVLLLVNIRRLTGQAASIDDIKQLTYMAYRFSSRILAIETVRAYYVGDRLLVEVDIVLPPDCRLQEAHDIGEALQDAFESMEIVERAFVHLDYTSDHEIEHRRVVESVGFG
ncbi:cation efflux family-domain-containing protein [Pilobolus umbonatus]|nr:cation efflux family-domain-containing protein [Pilobolus umbonatus]